MRPGDDLGANLACITSLARQAKLEEKAGGFMNPPMR